MKPGWIVEAEKYLGMKEQTGRNDHPLLVKAWNSFGLGWLIGQPYCGLFVGHCLRASGQFVPKLLYRAKTFATYGERVDAPYYGCIVVFERDGGGHVGFVVGVDKKNRLMVLGANQSNSVSIAPFERNRVLAYRIPFGYRPTLSLRVIDTNASSSKNEA